MRLRLNTFLRFLHWVYIDPRNPHNTIPPIMGCAAIVVGMLLKWCLW